MPSESDDRPPSSPADILSSAFRHAFDAVPPGIVIVDASGGITLVNSAAQRMFLYERDQLEGQPIQTLLPAANRPIDTSDTNDTDAGTAFFESSTGAGSEFTVLRRDGTEFQAEIGLRPLPTTEGIWTVASIVDLTQKQLTITDHEQNERAAAYCEAASEGMIAVDASGTIEMVNKATERIFGYDRAELVGQPLELVVPEGQRGPHAGKREGYFAKPGLRPMGTGSEFFGRRKDGTQFPVEVGLNVARIGDRIVAVAFITDISEKRRLQEQSAALGTLLDLQQQLSASRRREAASADSDPLTGLDRRSMFEPTVAKASADLEGLYAVVYSIRRMQHMKLRFGTKIADRIVVFASQYIANTLQKESDLLFRWEDTAFVSLIRRDSGARLVQREVADACGKRLECFLEDAGGCSIVMIALSVKVLPLAQMSSAAAVTEIEQFTRSGHGR